ncbi:hypothetical protein [Sphingobacterium sp. DR205]|nr:hypothetical protein [Sphingobacterium sp. DR205]QIH34400.1 hypothetical protein G6053_16565 [Sphingobacterium sp. DR205]
MKKTRIWPFLFILFLFALAIAYSRLITHPMALGKYYFKYHECGAIGELPDKDDTLTLLDDNKYRSSFWGNGEYRIEYGIFRTLLVLSYSGGTASYELEIKKVGNKITIVLDGACNFFYEKIE